MADELNPKEIFKKAVQRNRLIQKLEPSLKKAALEKNPELGTININLGELRNTISKIERSNRNIEIVSKRKGADAPSTSETRNLLKTKAKGLKSIQSFRDAIAKKLKFMKPQIGKRLTKKASEQSKRVATVIGRVQKVTGDFPKKLLRGGIGGIREAHEFAKDAQPRFQQKIREKIARNRQTQTQREKTLEGRKKQGLDK